MKAIEYFENKIKNKLPLYEETYVDGKPYRINILQLETNFTEEQANKTEIILKLISTLIAENKELKEENENLRNTNKKLYELVQRTAAQLFIEDYVKKSKVEEVINNNKPHIAQEKLQSLLGKE